MNNLFDKDFWGFTSRFVLVVFFAIIVTVGTVIAAS